MFLNTIITDAVGTKVTDYVSLIKQDVSFVNTSANKWQITVSFDLDATTMNSIEKEALTAILRYL